MSAGYTIIIKGKERQGKVMLTPDDPPELQAFLDVVAEKREPPNNKTSIIAGMHVKGFHPVRFQVDCGIEELIRLNLIKDTEKSFFGYTIKPNYEKAKVKNGVVHFD